MLENFNALNDITENSKGEIEINGYTKKALINSLIPGFSYFELICKPRLITDQTKINFSMDKIHKIIKDILRCNICLQIYNEPYNIKKCLHKFCKKCIEDYNRKVKKECAICRQVIEHRRVMREDVKIKNFIKCLIANIDEYNKVENKIFELYLPKYCHNKVQNQSTRKFSCENSPNQLIENTNEKFLEKKSYRREKEKENKEEFCKINSNETSAKEKHKEKEKICVKLIKEIAEESITSKLHLYIEDENITLDYLAKYICIKNKFPESFFDQIHFSINDSKKNKISICKSLSIKKIRIEFPFDNDKIILYFKTLKI